MFGMVPRVEVFIPTSQTEAFRKAVGDLGGKILKTTIDTKDAPLNPHRITPFKLYNAIKDKEPSFKSKFSYKGIFTSLRKLPVQRQEELLLQFFKEKVEEIPNIEKYVRFITQVNNMPTLKPTDRINQSKLQESVDEYSKRLNRAKPFQVAIERESLRDESFSLFSMTDGEKRTIRQANRPLDYSLQRKTPAREKDSDTRRLRGFCERHFSALLNIMALSLVNSGMEKDYYRIGEPLLEIFKAGAYPIGEKGDKFVVFAPRPKKI